MPTYVAFLRAINLGARRRFPAVDVVAATTAAGGSGVLTHLNTGNVRLDTTRRSRARVEAALEAAYEADRGFAVPTVVLTPAELRQVLEDAEELGGRGAAGAQGGSGGHPGRQYVSLLKADPSPEDAAALEARSDDAERVVVRARAAHLLIGDAYHEARISNATIERHLGVATNRNLTVVRTLVERWC